MWLRDRKGVLGLLAIGLTALDCELSEAPEETAETPPEAACAAWAEVSCGRLLRCCREGHFETFECGALLNAACLDAQLEADDAARARPLPGDAVPTPRACLPPLQTCDPDDLAASEECVDPAWERAALYHANALFCLGSSVCGDGDCGAGEEPRTCPHDCGVCGDHVCSPGESTTCPEDCPESCVSCGVHLGMGGELCPGESAALFEALMVCICEGACASDCASNTCAGEPATPECGACILDRDQGCGPAIFACADDF